MSNPILNRTFENQNFSDKKLESKEYDNCTFINCNFSGTDISVVTFLECEFSNCSFGSVMMKETSFQEVLFSGCKMLGLDFSRCNTFMFSVVFDHCNLDYTSFYGFEMKNTIFNSCSLKEVDFTGTNIKGTVFDQCDMTKAVFDNTNAEKADFRTAKNYIIDPNTNILKKTRFSKSGLLGLLIQYDLDIE